MSLPTQGSIVWAVVQAPNGERKRRPVVVVTADSEIQTNTAFRVRGGNDDFSRSATA